MEERKFKPGDRVRLIDNSKTPHTWRLGMEGTVVDEPTIVPGDVRVLWDTLDTFAYFSRSYEIELIGAEPVNAVSPDHYVFGDAQVIDITRHLDFLSGSAIKYLARATRKGDRLTDLKKARQFVDWLIEDAEKTL